MPANVCKRPSRDLGEQNSPPSAVPERRAEMNALRVPESSRVVAQRRSPGGQWSAPAKGRIASVEAFEAGVTHRGVNGDLWEEDRLPCAPGARQGPGSPSGRTEPASTFRRKERPAVHAEAPRLPPSSLRCSPGCEEGAGAGRQGAGWEGRRGCAGSRPRGQPPAGGLSSWGARSGGAARAALPPAWHAGSSRLRPLASCRPASPEEATSVICRRPTGRPSCHGKTAAPIPALSVSCVISFQAQRWIDWEADPADRRSPPPGSPPDTLTSLSPSVFIFSFKSRRQLIF